MRAALASCARALEGADARLVLVTGQAAAPLVGRLLAECGLSARRGGCSPVRNDFFGGNVDVAGLLTARDVLAQLPARLEGAVVVLPDVMFNSDGLTLDGMATHELLGEIESRGGAGGPGGFHLAARAARQHLRGGRRPARIAGRCCAEVVPTSPQGHLRHAHVVSCLLSALSGAPVCSTLLRGLSWQSQLLLWVGRPQRGASPPS